MQASLDEIADGVYRISTFIPTVGPDGFTFNRVRLFWSDSVSGGPVRCVRGRVWFSVVGRAAAGGGCLRWSSPRLARRRPLRRSRVSR